jgi:hypothetical protein
MAGQARELRDHLRSAVYRGDAAAVVADGDPLGDLLPLFHVGDFAVGGSAALTAGPASVGAGPVVTAVRRPAARWGRCRC